MKMMNHYKLLLRLKFKSTFSLASIKEEKKVGRAVSYAVLAVIGIAYFFLMIFFVFNAIFSSAIAENLAAGIAGAYLMLVILASSILNIRQFFGMFGSSRDLSFLLSLPVKPMSLFASELTSSYILEVLIHMEFLYPMLIPLLLRFGSPASWVLGLLLPLIAPCITIFAGCVFTLALMRLTRGLKRNDLLMSLLGLAAFAIFFFAVQVFSQKLSTSFVDGDIQSIISGADNTAGIMTRLFPPAGWVTLALINPANNFLGYIGFVLISLALLAALLWFGSKHYKNVISQQAESAVNRKRVKLSNNSSGAFISIMKKEFTTLLRSPAFSLNALSGLVIGPFFALLPRFSPGFSEISQFISTGAGDKTVFYIALGMMAFLCSIDPAASTIISREGKSAWIMQIMPVPAVVQILAKLVVPQIVLTLSLLLTAILMPISWPIPSNLAYLAALVALFANLPAMFFTALPDLGGPKLRWSNDQECMKRNTNTLVGMLFSVISLLPHLAIFVILRSNLNLAIIASIAFSIVASVVIAINLPRISKKCLVRIGDIS